MGSWKAFKLLERFLSGFGSQPSCIHILTPQFDAVLSFQVQTKLSQALRCAFPWDVPCGWNQPL